MDINHLKILNTNRWQQASQRTAERETEITMRRHTYIPKRVGGGEWRPLVDAIEPNRWSVNALFAGLAKRTWHGTCDKGLMMGWMVAVRAPLFRCVCFCAPTNTKMPSFLLLCLDENTDSQNTYNTWAVNMGLCSVLWLMESNGLNNLSYGVFKYETH